MVYPTSTPSPTKTPAPTSTPVPTTPPHYTCLDNANNVCLPNGDNCEPQAIRTGTCPPNSRCCSLTVYLTLTPTQRPSPTITLTPTPKPSCLSLGGDCLPKGEYCSNFGNGTCPSSLTVCCLSNEIPPTPTPTPKLPCTSIGGVCLPKGEYCSSFGTGICPSSLTVCCLSNDVPPTSTPGPSLTPTPPPCTNASTQPAACNTLNCCSTSTKVTFSGDQCLCIAGVPTPTPICVHNSISDADCSSLNCCLTSTKILTVGNQCRCLAPAPTATPTPRLGLYPPNTVCNQNSDCASNNCVLISSGVSLCMKPYDTATGAQGSQGTYCGATSFGTLTCGSGLVCANSQCVPKTVFQCGPYTYTKGEEFCHKQSGGECYAADCPDGYLVTRLLNDGEDCKTVNGVNVCKSGTCGYPSTFAAKTVCLASGQTPTYSLDPQALQDQVTQSVLTYLQSTAGQQDLALIPVVAGTYLLANPNAAQSIYGYVNPVLSAIPPWLGTLGAAADPLSYGVAQYQCSQGDTQACRTAQDIALANMAGFTTNAWLNAPTTAQPGSLWSNTNQKINQYFVNQFNQALPSDYYFGPSANVSLQGILNEENLIRDAAIKQWLANRPAESFAPTYLYNNTEVLENPLYNGHHNASTSDVRLSNFVDDIRFRLGNINDPTGSDISTAIYNRNLSIYQPDTKPWVDEHRAITRIGTSSPNGTTFVGDYLGTDPYCVGNVCYDNAIGFNAVSATYGREAPVLSFNYKEVDWGHAVNVFYDPITATQRISSVDDLFAKPAGVGIFDSTYNLSFSSLDEYIAYLNSTGKTPENFFLENIFVPKVNTPR